MHVHGTNTVLLALLYREDDYEAPPCRIVLTDGGNDAHINEAMLEIKAADQFTIGFDAIRIVDVAGLQERKQPRFRRFYYFLEPIRRVGAVTHELDQLHAGLGTFTDLKHKVDAIVRKLDDLGFDMDVETAAAPIHFYKARDVRLYYRS